MHAFSHKARAVFMFTQNELDACLFKRINNCQNFTTGHAKSIPTSSFIQPASDKVGGAVVWVGLHDFTSFDFVAARA
jgi:hypothetical protein